MTESSILGRIALLWFIVGGIGLSQSQGDDSQATTKPQNVPSFLRVHDANGAETLAVSAGKPVTLQLNLPTNETWTTANIGMLIVRAGDRQEHIDVTGQAVNQAIDYRFEKPGAALIALSAGPASTRGKSDSWEHTPYCTKLCIRVLASDEAPERPEAAQGVVSFGAKVGQRIELVPLVNPLSLRVGDDLPIRAFFNNGKQSDVMIKAFRTDGSVESRKTDSVGAAVFPITKAGRWLMRFEKDNEGMTYTADLVFDVLEAESKKSEDNHD